MDSLYRQRLQCVMEKAILPQCKGRTQMATNGNQIVISHLHHRSTVKLPMLTVEHITQLVAKQRCLPNLGARATGIMGVAVNPIVGTAAFDERVQVHLEDRIQHSSRVAVEFLAHRGAMVRHDDFVLRLRSRQCRFQPANTTFMQPVHIIRTKLFSVQDPMLEIIHPSLNLPQM